ncbi:MAG: hypothetical protein KJ070_25610 [Verrucomicrobia bacterium]|nr:hypothetical protein [Verrucomicrobiota bacterium]
MRPSRKSCAGPYVETNEAVRRRKASPDLVDEVLGFSEMVIGTGRAYTPASAAHPNGTQAVVAKEFRTIPEFGRTFLIETVNCLSIQNALDALPDCGRESGAAQRIRGSRAWDGYAFIPAPAQNAQANAQPRTSSGRFAHLGNPARSGVVIDYIQELGGTMTGVIVFRGDTTYQAVEKVFFEQKIMQKHQ